MPPAPPRASLTDVVPRRTLIIIAVVLLAVVGTVLAIALSGGDDDGGSGKNAGGPGTAADRRPATGSAPDADGSGTPASQDPATGADGQQPGDDDAGDADDDADDKKRSGAPEGYRNVSYDRHQFSMALPEGWKAHPVRVGGRVYEGGRIYRGDAEFPRVQVDFNDSPRSDAAAAWRSSESGARSSMPGYRGLGISSVEWRGYPTVADWRFERQQGGKRVRVLNRGFKKDDDQGYAIMVTCEKDKWDEEECRTLRNTAFQTFHPTG
ncbi:hypothetical protein [Streptomyces pactum]|uniref:hypothetical protein n=1 Tax=Streptomyces pactum TaxID=68249 RepID=UPI003558EA48